MIFINSLKLFGSNWGKALKFLLYYIVAIGISFALFLPVFFEFKDLVAASFISGTDFNSFTGIFSGALGENLSLMMRNIQNIVVQVFNANLGLAIYGLIVVFIFMPFFVNVGKYAYNEMLYSYMTSKNKIGFFSALIKSLRKSVPFAVCRTFYNLIFTSVVMAGTYGLSLVTDAIFVAYFFPVVEFLLLVVLYTFNQLFVLGWSPAMIVFDCNVFTAFGKGFKAVKRHYWSIFGTTFLYFVLLWGIMMLFGAVSSLITVPLMSVLLCNYNMVAFFTSQGMRYYISDNKILTPKKLEEVDNINKTAFIL